VRRRLGLLLPGSTQPVTNNSLRLKGETGRAVCTLRVPLTDTRTQAAAMRLGVRFTGVGCSSVGSAGLAGTPARSSGRSPAIEKNLHVRVRRRARAFLMMRPRRTGSVAQGKVW
jgi:hypothetical protein